jgi:hypothetical protein
MGKYGKQLLKWAKEEGVNHLSGQGKLITKLLTEYDEWQRWMPPDYNNINKFPTAFDFIYHMENTIPPLLEGAREAKAKKESQVFAEDGTWLVVIPKTWFASYYYGRNSDWCTSRGNEHYHYNQYANDGTLFMCMNKGDETHSLQIYIPGDNPKTHKNALAHEFDDTQVYLGSVPDSLIDLFRPKIDLTEILTDTEESHFDYYMNGDSSGPELEVWCYETERIGEGDAINDGPSFHAHFSIEWFSLDKLSPEGLEDLEDVDLTQQGVVIYVKDGIGITDLKNELMALEHFQNDMFDHAHAYVVRRWVDRFLGVPIRVDESVTVKWLADPDTKQPMFVVFLDISSDFSSADELVQLVGGALRFLPAAKGPRDTFRTSETVDVVYDGSHYSAHFMPLNGAGTMADAMQKPRYKGWLTGDYSDVPSWPEQEERDKQQKFEFSHLAQWGK